MPENRFEKGVARATRPPRSATAPTGTGTGHFAKTRLLVTPGAAAILSGGSPDGTGQWPVLPGTGFPAKTIPSEEGRVVDRTDEKRFSVQDLAELRTCGRISRNVLESTATAN